MSEAADHQRMSELPKGPIANGKPTGAPNRLRRAVAKMFGFGAVVLICAQLYNIRERVITASDLNDSPVVYSCATTDQEEYSPGDIIHFSIERTAKETSREFLPVALLIIDSFENLDTGDLFEGQITSRIIKWSGTVKFTITRRIPMDGTPGKYVFIGVVSSQTNRVSRATSYSSNTFTVRPRKP